MASSSARAMVAAFVSLGLDATAIQRGAGLTDAELDDPDGRFPASRLYRLWEEADRAWRQPALGLLAGAAVPVGAYDVLDYLVLTAGTLGEGITDLARSFAIVTSAVCYRVEAEGAFVVCALGWATPPLGIMAHLRDYSLATLVGRAREASGEAPARVDIAGPPLTTPCHYGEVFGAPARVNACRDAVVFTANAWRAPLARHDARLHRMLLRHAEFLLERSVRLGPRHLAERVRAALRAHRHTASPSVAGLARALGVSVRALQRRLQHEGTTFAALVDERRAGLARDYLCDPSIGIGEIAHRLGFSEPSAFSRAFRRWTGQSPRAFRAERSARR